MRTVLIGIARMGSSRLPGKVLMDLGGIPVLRWIWEAADSAKLVDDIVIATTTDPRDDAIEAICKENGIECYRGSEDDVLTRFVGAAIKAQATVAVRVTCDCPFIDPTIIDQVIALRETTGADYASNIDPPTWPDGMDCEAITVDALALTKHRATSKIDRECVTTYIQRNKDKYKCVNLTCPLPDMYKERWVLDTEADYKLCKAIADGCDTGTSWLQIKKFLDANPEVRQLNTHHPRNERFYVAIAEESLAPRVYTKSKELLVRAEKTIPLAAQTFSKSKIQYPANSPLFLTHGDGGYCFDVDGNRYVDLVGGLLPVILGHRDPDVDAAIRQQLDRGISFSLATELEAELSETLCRLIPSAEMTRFGKNGTDVTSAAVHLARAYTGRDLVLSSGYHGWADWSVAWDHVRNIGVPAPVIGQTVPFELGDTRIFDLLHGKKFAAVIVEPETKPNYLRELREFCERSGTLLIFDEIITWPRWGLAGAQGAFGVTPDLTCISKAMANGMPISALVGKREIMSHMEKISYSGTFFGETLSIAAAIATIKKLEDKNVIQYVHGNNAVLDRQVTALCHKYNSPIRIHNSGGLTRVSFEGRGTATEQDVKTLFIQEMAQAGTLIIASHNLSYVHGPNEIKRVLSSYDHALSVIKDAMEKNNIKDRIHGHSIPSYANVRAAS